MVLKKIADNRNEQSLATRFRRERFRLLQSLIAQLQPPINILDVGGTENYWRLMGLKADEPITITLLNLTPADDISLPNVKSVVGDARNINVQDADFDVVFSNSVIEHVGSYEDQRKMAAEVQRVGRRFFIQTPNKYFPLEPHFLFPFFQFLPVVVRVRLLQNFDLGWMSKTPDAAKAREAVESIRLLGKLEFMSLFPKANLYEEKILGLTKSFVAYGGWEG